MGRHGRRQPRVARFRPILLTLEQRLKRATPSLRKRFDPQCALQTIAWVIRQIEQRVDLRDGHALARLSHLRDFVAGSHLTFTENAEIEARPAAGCEQDAIRGSSIRMPTRKQVTRGCVTSKSAVPI